MRDRKFVSLGILVGALGLSVAAVSIFAQPPAAGGTKGKAKATTTKGAAKGATLRMPWGDPDLQGTWFVTEDVPLERSAANANKEFLTDAEVAEADARKGVSAGRNARAADATEDVSGAYNAVFNSVLKTGKRTSRITNPPDGKIPPLINPPAGRGAAAGRGGFGNIATQNDNPETTAQSPRCLGVALPFLPLNTAFAQGTVMQIVQSPKSMSIYMEDDHAGGGNRVIYMDGRPHPPANVKFFLGDSRGHWEGNSLVIETTNFSQGFRGSNIETYKMTERYTRTGPNSLRREITFEDPKTWTKPWTVLIDMGKSTDERHMIFDSACHEGNYGLTGLLVGSRREEQAKAKQK
jgi:hypothetical protein